MPTTARRSGSTPGLRLLEALLALAVFVSIVHYVDNFANFADYPEPTSTPGPPRWLIPVSWFVFTAFGVAGLLLYARRRIPAAAACLAIYSISGLIGIGHYSVPGATDMPWWRQVHVIADISCGIAVVAFAFWALHRRSAHGGSAGS